MGWTQKRKTKSGAECFRACYRDIRGQIQSAGTFAKEREADKAWQRAELKIAEGRLGNPRRGRQTFRRYVTEEWLPNHMIEASTREAYTYQVGKHTLPWFGPDLSIPGREVIQSRVDIDPQAPAVKHTHPGEEIIYVLQGSLEYQVEGQPTRTFHAGDALTVPAGAVHAVRNVGSGTGSVLATDVVEKGKPLLTLAD
jgi:quercetin dioxygenase-like cupin family protein